MPGSYEGHHGSGSNSARGSGAGFFALIVLGLGGWGAFALGAALGLTGATAFFAGAGIIVGGILAVGLVGYGVYKIVQGCRSAAQHYRQRQEERRHVVINDHQFNTRNMMQGMQQQDLYAAAQAVPPPPYNPAYLQPPGYASQEYLRQCEERRHAQDNVPSAPPDESAYRAGM